ncbi:MAG TPA: class I SAM-dependent methyltransferase [Vicinamibacterales bacterium]|nr:class I SAM-dependent methyltransferase [Vicinamibacterales bacterium]
MNPWVERFMEQPWVYRLWMAPFAEQKLSPMRRHNDLSRVRRVLDVGCGPGTNTPLFSQADYLGIDINPEYIASAKRRYNRSFVTADVTAYDVDDSERFDVILVNSLLHHLDTPATVRLLDHLKGLLTDDGRIHILELILPNERSVARVLAQHDRGAYPRSLAEWRNLLGTVLEPVVTEPYRVGCLGITLWNMVYFVGRRK